MVTTFNAKYWLILSFLTPLFEYVVCVSFRCCKPWPVSRFFPPWSGLAPSQKPVSKGVGTSSSRGVFPVASALSRLSVPSLASVEQAGTGKPLSFSPYGAKFPCMSVRFFLG